MNHDDTPGPAAANDNDKDGPPRTASGTGEARPEPAASVVSLQRERVRLDTRSAELEALMDEAYERARASFVAARKTSYDPELEEVYLKQAAMLANCHAKLLTTSDRHRKALREET